MVTCGEEVGNFTRGGREEISADDGVFVFVGTYPDIESAQADYELVKKLHSCGGIDTLVGILHPPSIAADIAGAAAGRLIGHLWRGMSRDDMKDLGEALDEGEAAGQQRRSMLDIRWNASYLGIELSGKERRR